MNATEEVILVDEADHAIGFMEKMQAHREGRLHRAFSILIVNSEGKWLLHKRAESKYHSGGLWTNTCCSHPGKDEATETAAHRRLKEEMGMKCELHHLFSFTYKAELDHGLIEHEFDHVYLGISDEKPVPNPEEVAEFAYLRSDEIASGIQSNPGEFTAWFKIMFPHIRNKIEAQHT